MAAPRSANLALAFVTLALLGSAQATVAAQGERLCRDCEQTQDEVGLLQLRGESSENEGRTVDNLSTKDELVHFAKCAEQAEQWEDMMVAAKKIAEKTTDDLTEDERNLFSVAYKNVVGGLRSAWRVLSSLEEKKDDKGEDAEMEKNYLKEIEKKLHSRCDEVIRLTKHLSKIAIGAEEEVFYYKMLGDYFRYKAEVSDGREKAEAVAAAEAAYTEATTKAERLPDTHPVKLGLALNLSVYYYEIKGDGEKAITIAKTAFDDALASLDSLKEDSYNDSTLIMQLLRDNLTLWSSELEQEEEQDDEVM